jgi:hypothetical protein
MLQYNSSGIAPSEVFMLPRDGDPDSAALDWDRMITGHPIRADTTAPKRPIFIGGARYSAVLRIWEPDTTEN